MHFQLPLTAARGNDGSPMFPTDAPDNYEIEVVLGTGLSLRTAAALKGTTCAQCFWEFMLPPDYNATIEITATVNAGYDLIGIAPPTKATLGLNAYLVDEVTGAMSVDQDMTEDLPLPASPDDLSFTIAGSPLKPGSRMFLVLTATVAAAKGTEAAAVIRSVRLSHP